MGNGPNRNRWFTELKNGDFPWRTASHNQMVMGIEQGMMVGLIPPPQYEKNGMTIGMFHGM